MKKKQVEKKKQQPHQGSSSFGSSSSSATLLSILLNIRQNLISPLSKEVCILLASTGYFHATDYTQLLDIATEAAAALLVENCDSNTSTALDHKGGKKKKNTKKKQIVVDELHSDEDIDEILTAMGEEEEDDIVDDDNQQQQEEESHRSIQLTLIQSMQSLAKALAEHNDDNSSSSNYYPQLAKEEQITSSTWETFQNVEDACWKLFQIIEKYKPHLSKQRKRLNLCRFTMDKLFVSNNRIKTELLFPPDNNNTSSTTTIDRLERNLIQCNLLFRQLWIQCKQWIDCEMNLLLEIKRILQEDNLYESIRNINGDDNDDDNDGGGGGVDSETVAQSPMIVRKLNLWSNALQKRSCINPDLCKTLQLMLQNDIVALNLLQNDETTQDNTDYNSDSEEEEEEEKEANYGYTSFDNHHHNQFDTIPIEEQNITMTTHPNRRRIVCEKLKLCSNIQDIIDTFLQQQEQKPQSFNNNIEEEKYDPTMQGEKESFHDSAVTTNTATTITNWSDEESHHGAFFFLLTGPSGSGKSHLLDVMHNHILHLLNIDGRMNIVPNVHVIRPKMQDLLGPSVGSMEDALISLFAKVQLEVESSSWNEGQKNIILFDDLEYILGTNIGTTTTTHDESGTTTTTATPREQSHVQSRIRNLFLSIMDKCKFNILFQRCLVICTAQSIAHDDDIVQQRFDKVFHLKEPETLERRAIIEQYLNMTHASLNEKNRQLLTGIVNASYGRSRGEIAHYCRDALNLIPPFQEGGEEGQELQKRRLQFIKQCQIAVPESIRNTIGDGFVEMNVLTAKELVGRVSLDENNQELFPLIGITAENAWQQMVNIIITPLCQSQELNHILHGGKETSSLHSSSQKQSVSAGLLLTGQPGNGKTSIAYHCASVAARINTSIRLLDVSCTSLVHKEVGGSERAIRHLFQKARAAAPCILLLDAIETIAPVRGNDNTSEGSMDRILSTLLTEMDGISTEDKTAQSSLGNNDDSNVSNNRQCIAVIGVTHDPSWIDPALLRPGRLEKCIELLNPEYDARKAILERELSAYTVEFSNATFFEPKDTTALVNELAMRTSSRSAAEVVEICKKSRLMASREIMLEVGKGKDVALDASKLNLHFSHFLRCLKE